MPVCEIREAPEPTETGELARGVSRSTTGRHRPRQKRPGLSQSRLLRAGLAALGVDDGPAGRGDRVAQAVGLRPVLRHARGGALVEHRLYLGGNLRRGRLLVAEEYDAKDNYVVGANIAGFLKVADAMVAHGCV